MLTLGDIMSTHVLALPADATLRDVIALFSEHHISGAPVMEKGTVVGVVSLSDVIDGVASQMRYAGRGGTSWTDHEDDVRSEDEETASWFTHAWLDGDEDALAELDELEEEQSDLLDSMTVADVMTRSIAELPSTTGVHEAAAYMLQRGIHRVLVVDHGRLEGLVSTTDFLKMVAERRYVAT